MPSQTNDSKQPSTLPREDLNPLLNPLLSQNMGRWAEVYFTNLPENREQAVLDLLRDLEAEAGLQQGSSDAPAAPVAGSSVSSIVDNSATLLRCPQCGYENRVDYNFCGACRAELRPPAGSAFPAGAHLDARTDEQERAAPDSGRNGDTWGSLPILGTTSETEPEESQTSPQSAVQHNFEDHEEHRKWKLFEPGDDRGGNRDGRLNEDRSNDDRENDVYLFRSADQPKALRPYHFFVGGVLVLVLLFFLYRTQWGKPAPPAISRAATPAPSANTPASATPGASAATPNIEAPNDDTPSNAKSNAASNVTSNLTSTKASVAPPSSPSPETGADTRGVAGNAARTAPAGAPIPADAQNVPSSANGEAEVALAKNLMSGANGKERDSAQAAELLWKAVSKQNAEASELLSDLYLRGDGVQKNCDQARVLLDAAASKGSTEAADRLRHLQAFGCE